jgi:TPR repeat protein
MSADQEPARGQCGCGVFLANGRVVAQDSVKAVQYFKMSTDQGYADAQYIGRPTSSVAQANLTIKINLNILRSFSSSNMFTIYLHAFLQSLHPSIQEKLRSRSPAGFPPE